MEQSFIEVSSNQTMNLLYNGSNLEVSNTLVHFACLDYLETYKTNYVPFAYIEYYLKNMNTYDRMFEPELKYFFDNINLEDLDVALLASVYAKSISSIAVAVIKKDAIEFIVADKNPVDLLSFYMETETQDTKDRKVYFNVKSIIEEMSKTDNLISKKSLFERYMIDKFLENYEPRNLKHVQTKNNADIKPETVAQEEIKKLDEDLKGREVDVPTQKGKVTKLFIPKLVLPSPFPILQDVSRINSDFKCKKLLRADQTINLFNKFKFKAVIYSTGFLEKRKKVKKPRPKFNFDF